MKLLKVNKTREQFKAVAMATSVFSNLGNMTNQDAIAHAYQSTQTEVGRKFVWIGENGVRVMAAGLAGDVTFSSKLDVELSEIYKDSEVFKQEPELITNLLEFAFYEGMPLFALIEGLDKQILSRESAKEQIGYFRSVHGTLTRMHRFWRKS